MDVSIMGCDMKILVIALLLITGPTRIHGPTQVKFPYGAWYSAPLQFGQVSNGCVERLIHAPGVTPGMPVAMGWPADLPPQVYGIAYAAFDGVVVRLCSQQIVDVPVRTFSAVAMTGGLP